MPPERGHCLRRLPSDPETCPRLRRMGQPTLTTMLMIGALDASSAFSCKALRILIREGRSMEQIERCVCWRRLSSLHRSLPRQYSSVVC